jgi:hypothetical protein
VASPVVGGPAGATASTSPVTLFSAFADAPLFMSTSAK